MNMKKWFLTLPTILFLITILMYSTSFSLESLTPTQMKNTVARAGVDIAISNAATETHTDHFTLLNPDQDKTLYHLKFNNFHSITTVSTGLDHISLDVGEYNNEVMFFAESPALSISTDFTVDSIIFCNENIGRLGVEDMNLSSFHLYAGPHADNGIDFEFGEQLSIKSFTYQYNSSTTSGFLALTGITFANTFLPTGANGEFLIGNLSESNPAKIDILSDDTAEWIPGVVNPRLGTAFISLDLPMQGSIHIDNVTMGGNNFGNLAIDNINIEKLYIEIPGRGLGK